MATYSNDFGLPFALSSYQLWSAGSSTSQVKTGVGKFRGIFVSTIGTAPLLSVFDSTGSSTGTLISSLVPAAGTLYHFGTDVIFVNGLYVSGGTCNFSVIYY